MMNKNKIEREMEQLNDIFKRTNYVKGILRNYIRQIDHLRVSQIMAQFNEYNRETLIQLCCNSRCLITNFIQAQNQIHQLVCGQCIEFVKVNVKKYFSGNNNNDNGNDEKKDDINQISPENNPNNISNN